VAGFGIMFYRTGRGVGTLAWAKVPKPYRPTHLMREPPSVAEEEPYVLSLLHQPLPPVRLWASYMPPRPPPRAKVPTEPSWPFPDRTDWAEQDDYWSRRKAR
jgi:hypothetical protein